MPSNQEILRAVITTTTQGTPGSGLLSPDQFIAFYELAEEATPWAQLQNTEKLKAHTGSVQRIDYGEDVIRPATEAVDSGEFVSPSHDAVPYTMVKGRTSFKVSNEALTQSADPNYQNKLVNGFTRAWGRSHQKLAWNGDTTSLNPMLLMNDGWLKTMEASGNAVDGSTINGGSIVIDHFQAALQALPEAWQQRQDELKWGMTMTKWNQYTASLSSRATGQGDDAHRRGKNGEPLILGIEVVPVPTLTRTGDEDSIVLTTPENTTVVMDPQTFRLRAVTDGVTVVSQDIIAYFGFFYSDYVLLEVEGTSIIHDLDN